MLETKLLISKAKEEARSLDQLLIDGRKPVVGRNLEQIEQKKRSEKYVSRLAGISDDVYRRSVSERFVEWFGATAAEDNTKAELVGEFLRPLLAYPSTQTIFIQRDFFDVDQTIAALFSQLRKSVVSANKLEAKFYCVQIKCELENMLKSIEGMEQF